MTSQAPQWAPSARFFDATLVKEVQNPSKRSKKGNYPTTRSQTDDKARQCAKCFTQETPQWRYGITKGVVLCNACGLKYSKALKQEQNPANLQPNLQHEQQPQNKLKMMKIESILNF